MADPGPSTAIRAFAEQHGLLYDKRADLPEAGDLLSRSDSEAGPAATGKLPGDLEGVLAHYTYETTDSDHHTQRHPFTLVVARVPESIGFLPYLGFSGPASGVTPGMAGTDNRQVEVGKGSPLDGAAIYVDKGVDDSWLGELLSPALIDWLARSADDFGFELAGGVLCAARDGHLSDSEALAELCRDGAHIAAALRAEALEEVHTGGAERSAARRQPAAAEVMVENAMARFGKGREVRDVTATVAEFRSMILRNPGTWIYKLVASLLILLAINIPGIALPIVLGADSLWVLLAAIEGALLAIIYFFVMRSHLRGQAEKYATEAFFRAYAEQRGLELEDPLRFAATHAEAELPFKPERVLTGPLPGGGEGALALSGTGLKRSDRIALVRGPAGPVAAMPLEVSPPGLSVADLDAFAKRLAAELSPRVSE